MNTLIAALTSSKLVNTVLELIIIGVIFGLVLWIARTAPFVPDAWRKFVVWFVYLVGVLFVINWLLTLLGKPLFPV